MPPALQQVSGAAPDVESRTDGAPGHYGNLSISGFSRFRKAGLRWHVCRTAAIHMDTVHLGNADRCGHHRSIAHLPT